MAPKPKAIISWSGGKDSALALWKSRDRYDITALVTTVTETFDRISMHGVRRRLLELQAAALGIPLHVVSIPWPCPNEVYEARMRAAFAQFQQQGVDNVICGDIFLEDVRRYREERLLPKGSGVFPLWGVNTRHLIQEFFDTGYRAILCCVDTQAIPGDLAGRLLDPALLAVGVEVAMRLRHQRLVRGRLRNQDGLHHRRIAAGAHQHLEDAVERSRIG